MCSTSVSWWELKKMLLPALPALRSSSRLIENQQLGIIDECLGQRQPLLHAPGILPSILAVIGQTNGAQQLADILRQLWILDPIQACGKLHAAIATLRKKYRDIGHKTEPCPRLRIPERPAQQGTATG